MLKYYDLLSSQRPTVAAVGVFAYKDTLRRLPSGVQYFELVPEPDNPYDDHAISIRSRGNVVGYIPRERTSTYWPIIARITASGMTARIKGKLHKNGNYFDVSVYLLSGDKALTTESGLVAKSHSYTVPPAYGHIGDSTLKTPSEKFNHTKSVAFTEQEKAEESARRRREWEESYAQSGKKSHSSNLTLLLVIAGVVLLVIILM
ncbi:hypothetical protein FRC0031_00042 [Corynebacterium diphtheriae]|nr:hypothetical protein FRC0037_00043 [Corynebacterium diphtheriae]CAB0672632.1 hypothetical protein FRC0031_00042 [Corynebacterium diphtheriae]CAB0849937.1 hypothetical protein FRC0376_00479 [Corynebacterium diphtheriae]CAB0891233.1 hypothetical protein FRC0409_00374 [Corynebacterium diphtheriae]CAB1030444.1 hypothetical protein FRC0543_00383 [Corynebacterium diphtheriae]